MTPLAQRIAIAEACGWKLVKVSNVWRATCPRGFMHGCARTPNDAARALPDYLNDLNAMHEAKNLLTAKQKRKFAEHLCDILGLDDDYYVPRPEHGDRIYHVNSRVVFDIASATAKQQAKAFLRTIGKMI